MKHRDLTHRLRLLLVLAFCAIVASALSGCFTIPKSPLVIRGSHDQVLARLNGPCDSLPDNRLIKGVNPDGFTLLSWNAHKGSAAGWKDELRALGSEADFILLQEADLDGALREQMSLLEKEWLLAVAFVYDEEEIGIFSAGKTPPLAFCTVQEYEPLFKIPKVVLASSYRIEGVDSRLLILNLHLVNFTFESEVVRRQIRGAREQIRNHSGPVIVAGDFNTWNAERESIIQEEMEGLGLQPVSFSPDERVTFFGRTVDAVYYRGLEVTGARAYQNQTSDHNPLEVHFRLPEVGRR